MLWSNHNSLMVRLRRRAVLASIAVGVVLTTGGLGAIQALDIVHRHRSDVSAVVSAAIDARAITHLLVLGTAVLGGLLVLAALIGRTAFDLARHQESEHDQTMFHLLDQLPVGVLVITPDGKPWFANQSAHAMLGPVEHGSPEIDALASSYAVYQAGTDTIYPTERAPLTRALAGEVADVSDMELHRGDEIVPLHVYGSPIRNRRGEIAFAVATFQNVHTLHRAAHEDALTGLPNRLAATHVYKRECLRCARSDRPLAVAILDLDRFKSVNDAYGHPMGDEVLQRISTVVTRTLRKTDLVARWGGEELIVLLPETDLVGAEHTISRTLDAVMDEPFMARDGRRFRISFSAGIVVAGANESFESAVARADIHLYAAKRAGRARVVAKHDVVNVSPLVTVTAAAEQAA